jgi:hypothetical protein
MSLSAQLCRLSFADDVLDVEDVGGDVVAEGVAQVCKQALDGSLPGEQGLHGEAQECNLQSQAMHTNQCCELQTQDRQMDIGQFRKSSYNREFTAQCTESWSRDSNVGISCEKTPLYQRGNCRDFIVHSTNMKQLEKKKAPTVSPAHSHASILG